MDRYAVVIAGPSGAGKTTIADSLIETLGNLEMSRSATTRAKRGDGRDDEYVYISCDEFERAIKDEDVVEYTIYSGNYYGTRKCELDRIFLENKHPILVLDYNGVRSLKEKLDYPVFAIYVYTTLDEAERRLRERDLRSYVDEKHLLTFSKRQKENIKDYSVLFSMTELFDYYVENADINVCTSKIIDALDMLKRNESPMSLAQKRALTDDFMRQYRKSVV